MSETLPATTERTSYQPMAQVGSVRNMKALVESAGDSLRMVLPKHVTPDRLIKTLLVAVNRNPDLLKCTQSSVIETISRAGELGLDLSGTLGEAYPVPFNNRVKVDGNWQWATQCTLIIGYRGLAKLARQSGEIKRIESDVVCEHDTFEFSKGSGGCCRFSPNLKDRGEPIGAFAYVEFKDGGEQYEFMPMADIDGIRRRSKSGSDKDGNPSGPWKTDWPEMAKKTVFRRLAKWLPLSAEKFRQAVEQDNDDYEISSEVLDVRRIAPGNDGTSKVEALAARLTADASPQTPPAESEQPSQPDTPPTADAPADGQQADAEPDPMEDAIAVAAETWNLDGDKARAAVFDASMRLYDKPPAQCSADELIELANGIANGIVDVSVKQTGKKR